MTDEKCRKTKTWKILILSVLAAAWIMVSSDILQWLGLTNQKIIDILAFVPAIGIIIMAGANSASLAKSVSSRDSSDEYKCVNYFSPLLSLSWLQLADLLKTKSQLQL